MALIVELVREAYSNWDDVTVLARIGQELHERNRLPIAGDVLRRAVELDPSHVDAWSHLGFVHLRGYAPARGLAILREGIEATGSDRLRCSLAAFLQEPDEKAALLKQVADNEDPEVRSAAAGVRIWQGDKDALGEIERLHGEHSDSVFLRENWWWTMLGLRARGVRKDLDLSERAIPSCDRAIEREPERILAHWMKAQMLLHEKDWGGLLTATAEALDVFPDDETMMFLRGRAHKENGDLPRAVQWFSRAIGAKPSYASARTELGKVFEAWDKADLAEDVFREIPQANPEFAGGPMALAAFLGRRERWAEAEKLFLDAWRRLEPWQHARLKPQPDLAPLLARDNIKAGVEGRAT